MYSHPSTVPIDCAMALYRIIHNLATDADWETLDRWVKKETLGIVVDRIVETLRMNGVNRDTDERRWWLRELATN